MIMGNAFAAITVMTVGIGANFNIVPVAMLDMKDRMGVIKKQVLPAMVMIVVQIVYMLIAQ